MMRGVKMLRARRRVRKRFAIWLDTMAEGISQMFHKHLRYYAMRRSHIVAERDGEFDVERSEIWRLDSSFAGNVGDPLSMRAFRFDGIEEPEKRYDPERRRDLRPRSGARARLVDAGTTRSCRRKARHRRSANLTV